MLFIMIYFVVSVVDVFYHTQEQAIFSVMEFAQYDLDKIIERKPFPFYTCHFTDTMIPEFVKVIDLIFNYFFYVNRAYSKIFLKVSNTFISEMYGIET